MQQELGWDKLRVVTDSALPQAMLKARVTSKSQSTELQQEYWQVVAKAGTGRELCQQKFHIWALSEGWAIAASCNFSAVVKQQQKCNSLFKEQSCLHELQSQVHNLTYTSRAPWNSFITLKLQ